MAENSFESQESHESQRIVHMCDFLTGRDEDRFMWDNDGREAGEAWNKPVRDVGLDPRKHKVFHHGGKSYLRPPEPFIQSGAELGESGSTVVYRVYAPEESAYCRPLALKVITCKETSRTPGPDSRARKLALQEVRSMASIRHPHIVVYVASFEDYCMQLRETAIRVGKKVKYIRREEIKKHILGIAMYPPAAHNLSVFMKGIFESPDEDSWKVSYLMTYFGCLAQAVAYLHKSGVRVRHKDIKPENIVIDEYACPLLTDFGLSKHFEEGKLSEGPTMKTVKYADPEATHEEPRDERSDIFSLGAVFLEMATVLMGQPAQYAEQQLFPLSNGGRGEFKYAECSRHIEGYLKSLPGVAQALMAKNPSRKDTVDAVVQILPVIKTMMHEHYTKRPYASELYPAFRHLYDVHESPGPCRACEDERVLGYPHPRPVTPNMTTTRSSTNVSGGSQKGMKRANSVR